MRAPFAPRSRVVCSAIFGLSWLIGYRFPTPRGQEVRFMPCCAGSSFASALFHRSPSRAIDACGVCIFARWHRTTFSLCWTSLQTECLSTPVEALTCSNRRMADTMYLNLTIEWSTYPWCEPMLSDTIVVSRSLCKRGSLWLLLVVQS